MLREELIVRVVVLRRHNVPLGFEEKALCMPRWND